MGPIRPGLCGCCRVAEALGLGLRPRARTGEESFDGRRSAGHGAPRVAKRLPGCSARSAELETWGHWGHKEECRLDCPHRNLPSRRLPQLWAAKCAKKRACAGQRGYL